MTSETQTISPSGPLSGVVVVDLTRALAGPHAAMLLGDLGARVIKVESPSGDESRTWGPPFVEGTLGRESTYFLCANRNKESVTADLKTERGSELLSALVQRADVLMENFRPGVMDRLGFSEEDLHRLNPRLVVLSISGFGHDGPDRDRAGYDQIAQGEAGLMSMTGTGEPTKVGVPISDLVAGMNGALGVIAALYERERTGIGRVVRTSLLASIVGLHAYQGTKWTVAHVLPGPSGNRHPSIAPYGMFRTKSGLIQIACASDHLWGALCSEFGLDANDPRFATNADRVAHRDAMSERIEAAMSGSTSQECLSRLRAAGVPAGAVRGLDEVYSSAQVQSQGLLLDVDHSSLGPIQLPGSAIRFDSNPFSGGRSRHSPPPVLGEHDEAVRQWLAETEVVRPSAGRS